MSKKNIPWSDRRIVGKVRLTTPNGVRSIAIGHAITDEGADSFVGRLEVDGREVALPHLDGNTIGAVENWTLAGSDGVGSVFTWDYQTKREKTEAGENISTRLDRKTYRARVDLADGDDTVRVCVEWAENDRGFSPKVSAQYRSDGQRGAESAPRIDAGTF